LIKLKSLSEGFTTTNGINEDNMRRQTHINYGELKMKAPMGELCTEYKADLKGKYRWLAELD
jgi:hypothetical protein